MHIHGNSMSIQAANFYSASQGEKTAAERAAEVRKRLLKSAVLRTVDGLTAQPGNDRRRVPRRRLRQGL